MTQNENSSSSGNETEAAYKRRTFIDSRATFRERAQWRVEAFAWDHIYWNRFSKKTIDQASDDGAKLIRKLGPIFGKSAHRTATRNLAMAFPEWSKEQVEECALKSWENFGRIAGELPHVHKIRVDGDDPRLNVEGAHHVDAINALGKPCVIISCHMANWEVMAQPITSRLKDCVITYRSANNPHIDKRIADARLQNSVGTLAAKGTGTRDLMRALASKRSVALMNDQKYNEGVPIPFFGHDAMTAPGPTRMAHRYKIPLLPISTRRTAPARYTVTFHAPIWTDQAMSADEAVADTLPKITAWTESQIRAAPDQWFWQHNRWPKEAWKQAGVM
ncbi:lysophospholipid acyltransferase family protein [Hirschia baltica]|uniref:Lipid A biosynthesis acyltransferase n=1 Tax=Hirschia baltica (strain ATCC 49814 / DSM 5838 / IFAM 1418) TaxID=582402 RepID=C6XQU0_HIRBI|nr:lysophospholipid acyltransferase family protein [Hirschia baltica]ACT58696.1 lipid A biosynthesis acyltransferase [Hirschia baltica ATCC 49814]